MDPVLYIASLSRGRQVVAGIAVVAAVTGAILYFFANVADAQYVGFTGVFLTLVSLSDTSGTGGGGPGLGGGDGGGGGGHGGCGPGGPC